MQEYNQKALTLLELLLAVALSVLMIFFGTIAYRHFVQKNHKELIANRLASALRYARSEAMHRGEPVTFCPSVDGKRCSGNWSQGWLLKTNRGAVLYYFPAITKPYELDFHGSLSKNTSIIFNSQGFTLGQQGSFCLRIDVSDCLAQVVLIRSGRVRVFIPDLPV